MTNRYLKRKTKTSMTQKIDDEPVPVVDAAQAVSQQVKLGVALVGEEPDHAFIEFAEVGHTRRRVVYPHNNGARLSSWWMYAFSSEGGHGQG